jgi:diadenosine tetraphosphate (Ap4A) HIT family hydrolase
MATVIHERVEQCRDGTYPQAICRVSSGWVVLGDKQFLEGYSLIYPDPVVADLNKLDAKQRKSLFYEASVVGDALLEITGAVRINYEILGNLAPALHLHIFPRFDDEPEALRTAPAWSYDWAAARAFDPGIDAPMMNRLRDYLVAAGLTE